MPVIWAHSGYSMLSIGIALLPLYLWTTHRLCEAIDAQRTRTIAISALALVAVACLAVFTDGYTFVMFAFGALVQYAGGLKRSSGRRVRLLGVGMPIYAAGFGLAFVLYRQFVGTQSFTADPLSVFRGFGVDITMLVRPTQGLLGIWDVLRVSTPRSDSAYFGDASVWVTTFIAPIAMAGLAGFALSNNKTHGVPLLVLGMLATYLALGPSLKVHSVRPDADRAAGNFQATMPPEYAVAPTGTAYLSTHVPGFRNMRASYRWSALTVLAFWALFVLLIAELSRRDRNKAAWWLLGLVMASNLPNPESGAAYSEVRHYEHQVLLHAPLHFRDQFAQLDQSIVADFRQDAPKDGITAFFPRATTFSPPIWPLHPIHAPTTSAATRTLRWHRRTGPHPSRHCSRPTRRRSPATSNAPSRIAAPAPWSSATSTCYGMHINGHRHRQSWPKLAHATPRQ